MGSRVSHPVLADVAETPLHFLEDLLAKPELLKTPPTIVPHFAFQGRVTLLAAGEKVGKSTLMGQAVAACVEGAEFLGEAPANRLVLWVGLDEPLGDIVRRLARHGLGGGVYIYDELPSFVELEASIEATGAGVAIIDTLTEFAAGVIDDPNSPRQWQPVLKVLRGIAQRTSAAIILLHHVNKSTGKYRDSSQIGAGVDQIVEMNEVENDPTLRKVRVRGRCHSETFNIRYIGDRYELEGAELPLDVRVRRAIESNPGIGMTKLRTAVGGKGALVDDVVKQLRDDGLIEDRKVGIAHAYYVTPTALQNVVSAYGQLGTDAGQTPVPDTCPDLFQNGTRDRAAENFVSDEGQAGTDRGQALGQPLPVPNPYIGDSGTGVEGSSDIPPCSFCGMELQLTVHRTYRCPDCCPDNRWASKANGNGTRPRGLIKGLRV